MQDGKLRCWEIWGGLDIKWKRLSRNDVIVSTGSCSALVVNSSDQNRMRQPGSLVSVCVACWDLHSGCVAPASPLPGESFGKFRLTLWPRLYNSKRSSIIWAQSTILGIWCHLFGQSWNAHCPTCEFKRVLSETRYKTHRLNRRIHMIYKYTYK